MSQREPFTQVAIGQTGIGKSFQTMKIARRYEKPNPKTGWPGKPVLILDFNNEHQGIKTLHPFADKKKRRNGVQGHTAPGLRRIKGYNEDGSVMSSKDKLNCAKYCVTHFRNGLIFIDDPDKYMVFSQDQDVIGMFMSNRHYGLDIVMSHQSWANVTVAEWRNLTHLRIHKTIDSPQECKNKINGEHLPILTIADTIVKKVHELGEQYFYMLVNVRKHKMWGCSVETFKWACDRYIFENNMLPKKLKELEYYGKIPPGSKNTPASKNKAKEAIIDQLMRYYSEVAVP